MFDRMITTDDQVGGVLDACVLPIINAGWDLNTDGVKPEVAEFIRDQIGLPKPGEPRKHRRRGQAGIVWLEHLREALNCLAYGFAPFEQVYTVTMPGELGHPVSRPNNPAVQLRKLAQRMPSTIKEIRVDRDGGLVSIVQHPAEGDWDSAARGLAGGEIGIEIPVDRLVFYVIDKEGADWSGRSILRRAYRPWFLKEQLLRAEAIRADRNSLGIPVVRYDPQTANREAALEVAAQARTGMGAGVAVPLGMEFQMVGVAGATVDLDPAIRRHDQAISRSVLAMFMDLGHDAGARSLGDTFLTFFADALAARARLIASTFTEHVIRDLVVWNWGDDEAYPEITPGRIAASQELLPAEFQQLVAAQVLTADATLEEHVRQRYRLPAADTASTRQPVAPPVVAATVPAAQPEGDPTDAATMDTDNPFRPAFRARYAEWLASQVGAAE